MSRPLSVSVFSVILIVFFFGMASLYQSCSGKKKSDDLTTEEKAVQVAETYTKESYFEDDESVAPANTDPSELNKPESEQSTQENKADLKANPPVNRPQSTNVSRQKPGGNYSVVAGNYLVKTNAEAMADRLLNAGYSGAEVVVFELSQYYTVIAGRYNSYSDASNDSDKLKNLGVDNYVLTKK